MPQTIFYNVHHEHAMGVLVVVYFFLSGLGAGTFLTAAGCRIFGGGKYAKIERTAAIAAPILLVPGLLCLMLDLGKPFRFFNLMLHFNPLSIASWGVWLINIFMAVSVIYALAHIIGKSDRLKPLAYLGGLFALAVGLYSGMLLYQMRAHELWHSALVPPIFLISAIASGLAMVLLLSRSAGAEQRRTLSHVLAVAGGGGLGRLRDLRHQRLRGQQQAGDGGGVLQRRAGHLGGVDNAVLEQVAVLVGVGVVAVAAVLVAAHLVHHHHPLHAAVLGDHAQRLFQRLPEYGDAGPLVGGEGLLQLVQGNSGAKEGDAAAGHDPLLNGGPGG